MNNENNNDVYHDDTSFDNQGIVQNEEPTTSQELGNAINSSANFAKSAKNGINNINNLRNNPAFGVKKPKENNDASRGNKPNSKENKKSTPNDNSEKNNPAKGQKTDNKNDNKNKLPGTVDRPDKKKDNNKSNDKNKNNKAIGNSKQKGMASRFNPLNRLGLGKKSGIGKKGSNSGSTDMGESVKNVGMMGFNLLPFPVKVKVVVIATSIILVIILAALILLAVFGGTTAAVTAAMCGESDYSGDSVDTDSIQFICNMQDPVKNSTYTVTSLYGWRDYDGDFHTGIDLASNASPEILAAQDGEVTYAGVMGGYGNFVTIRHGSEDTESPIYTAYAHLQSIKVSKGQRVKVGDPIGIMGTTGYSDGIHLHFEVRSGSDNNQDTVSANFFFGYSDKGYDKCLDRTTGFVSKCDQEYSGSARKIGPEAFEQICGKTKDFSSSTSGSSDDCCKSDITNSSDAIIKFINGFEASNPPSCTTKSGKEGYVAENLGDGTITAGYGITNYVVGNSASQAIIKENNATGDFTNSGGKYIMRAGDCVSKSTIDKIQLNSIQNNFGAAVTNSAEKNNVSLSQYEKDALTSFNYNLGSGHIDKLVTSFKDDGYQGLWNSMKGYVHSGGQTLPGLQKRRKAEFALFVTGDYTDRGLFYSRNIYNYDDFDSENVMARKATGNASECRTVSGDKEAVVEIALREYEDWNSSKKYCESITKYLAACGYNNGKGGIDDYCAGFVSYVLKEAGVEEQIGLVKSCFANDFEEVSAGTVKPAGGSYIPEPGDVMMTNGGGHVVIVEKVEGERVYYIGGNEGTSSYCGEGAVVKGSFSLTSGSIYKYVTY